MPRRDAPARLTVTARAAVLPDASLLSPAHLTVENGVFTRVSRHAPKIAPRAPRIDLPDALLFPGFVNAHCHLDLTAAGPLRRAPFASWVRALMRRRGVLTPAKIARGIRHGALSLARSGVVRVFDHVDAFTPTVPYADLPVEVVAFGEALGLSETRADAVIEALRDARGKFPGRYHLTPHSVYSLKRDALAALLRDEPGPFSVHVQESSEEREFFAGRGGTLDKFLSQYGGTENQGKSALRVLSKALPRGKGLLAVHANYLDAADFKILKELKKRCVVHCPGSFDYFGHGEFPYGKLRRLGIPVALGTDSLASNDGLDFLEEVRKFLKRFPRVRLEELLPMLAQNAMDFLGEKGGRIAEGFAADLTGFRNPRGKAPLTALVEAARADFLMVRGERIKIS